jgi:hypothetical protein
VELICFQVKYVQAAEEQDPTLHLQPPPEISNGIFSWFSPVLHVAEKDMLQQIGAQVNDTELDLQKDATDENRDGQEQHSQEPQTPQKCNATT